MQVDIVDFSLVVMSELDKVRCGFVLRTDLGITKITIRYFTLRQKTKIFCR